MSRYEETSERLSDPLDVGAQAAERFVKNALAEARRRANPDRPDDFDGENCACGTPIPVARVAAGHYTCIDCRKAKEHQNKMRGLPIWAA